MVSVEIRWFMLGRISVGYAAKCESQGVMVCGVWAIGGGRWVCRG
jgi:hypothetical protein